MLAHAFESMELHEEVQGKRQEYDVWIFTVSDQLDTCACKMAFKWISVLEKDFFTCACLKCVLFH